MSVRYFKNQRLNDFFKAIDIWNLQAKRYVLHHPPLHRLCLDIAAFVTFGILALLIYGLFVTFPFLIPFLNEHFGITPDSTGPVWVLILPTIYFVGLFEFSLYVLLKFVMYLVGKSLTDKRLGSSFLLYPLTVWLLVAALRMVDWSAQWASIVNSRNRGWFEMIILFVIAAVLIISMALVYERKDIKKRVKDEKGERS